MKNTLALPVLALLALASLALGLAMGSVPVGAADILAALSGQAHSPEQGLILELRLPRVLCAFVTGAMLALAGALMQVLLRNPLADPYVLGISGGAGAAALGAMWAGLGGWLLTGSAFLGALASTLLVFGLIHGGRAWTPTRLLLTGVVIAMGWGALISLILSLAPEAPLRGMLFWLMGDLGYASWPLAGAVLLGLALALALPLARDLNLLTRGELQAGALGVAITPLRWKIYFLAALLTGGAVVQAGSIGFVGLIVPHILRLLGCTDHRVLLPAAILLGGSILVAADALARSALAPQQLPAGVIMALLGVPVFLYLLRRQP